MHSSIMHNFSLMSLSSIEKIVQQTTSNLLNRQPPMQKLLGLVKLFFREEGMYDEP